MDSAPCGTHTHIDQAAQKVMINKVFKWSRRGLVALTQDRHWRRPGMQATWVGSPSGGAYADLSRLPRSPIVYSFGIACEISFDRAIIETSGAEVFGFDPDPRSEAWLARPEVWVPDRFHFMLAGIDASSGRRSFYMTDMERMTGSLQQGTHHSDSVEAEFLNLGDMMARLKHDWVDYLKLDVEGAEYGILDAWIAAGTNLPVGQLWVEFHPDGKAYTEASNEQRVRSLQAVGMECGYRDYFRHPNNYLLVNRQSRLA